MSKKSRPRSDCSRNIGLIRFHTACQSSKILLTCHQVSEEILKWIVPLHTGCVNYLTIRELLRTSCNVAWNGCILGKTTQNHFTILGFFRSGAEPMFFLNSDQKPVRCTPSKKLVYRCIISNCSLSFNSEISIQRCPQKLIC